MCLFRQKTPNYVHIFAYTIDDTGVWKTLHTLIMTLITAGYIHDQNGYTV